MQSGWRRGKAGTALTVMTLVAAAGAAQAANVYGNSGAPGDSYTNPTGSNMGQAVGTSGWYYNNVRANGKVGIDTAYAHNGNASVHFQGPSNAKADIEFLPGALQIAGNYNSTASLGKLSDLTSMSYDWYRDSASTASSNLHPSLRVLLDLDGDITTTNDRGGLVFERSYNTPGNVPTNTWVTDIVTASTKLWNFGLGLGTGYDLDHNGYAYDSSLADWKAAYGNAAVIGFSSGIGSGWDTFYGAVDNISWTFGTQTTTSNFEVLADPAAVPEPASVALVGAALAGLVLTRRRKA